MSDGADNAANDGVTPEGCARLAFEAVMGEPHRSGMRRSRHAPESPRKEAGPDESATPGTKGPPDRIGISSGTREVIDSLIKAGVFALVLIAVFSNLGASAASAITDLATASLLFVHSIAETLDPFVGPTPMTRAMADVAVLLSATDASS